MRVHHLSHHQTYTDKLNAALATLRSDPKQKHLAKMGIDTLMTHLPEIEDTKIQSAVRNAGGGYVNHEFFFKSMSPTGGGLELGQATGSGRAELEGLVSVLSKTFGSVDMFKKQFTVGALEVFGSGWVW